MEKITVGMYGVTSMEDLRANTTMNRYKHQTRIGRYAGQEHGKANYHFTGYKAPLTLYCFVYR